MAINKVIFGGNTIIDITDTTATAGKIASGYTAYGANGVKVVGTLEQEVNELEVGGATVEGTAAIFDEGGGTPSQTQHTIYFEFSDSTDATITAYWDGTFISDAITATAPLTYDGKTVTLAELDGVAWYPSAQETVETLFDGNKDANTDTPYNYFWFETLGDVYPTVGSVWRVTIDGTVYRCVAYALSTSFGNLVCFGNPKYTDNGTDNGTSAPFNFYNAGWGALVADTELTQGSHSVKIERVVIS